MTTPMDVLLIESRPGAARAAAESLEAAGHRVHRCHEPGEPAFPCKGLVDPTSCPLAGHIDVALLVRPRVAPRPTAVEDGVSCALRAGVPLVEQGSEVLDPYGPWVTVRVHTDDDVVPACEDAIQLGDEPLRADVLHRCSRLLQAAGIDPVDVGISVDRRHSSLVVRLDVPGEHDRRLEHALSVRALDAVRSSSRRTVGQADVYVNRTGAPVGALA